MGGTRRRAGRVSLSIPHGLPRSWCRGCLWSDSSGHVEYRHRVDAVAPLPHRRRRSPRGGGGLPDPLRSSGGLAMAMTVLVLVRSASDRRWPECWGPRARDGRRRHDRRADGALWAIGSACDTMTRYLLWTDRRPVRPHRAPTPQTHCSPRHHASFFVGLKREPLIRSQSAALRR